MDRAPAIEPHFEEDKEILTTRPQKNWPTRFVTAGMRSGMGSGQISVPLPERGRSVTILGQHIASTISSGCWASIRTH